eukprot:851999-Amphidinium_carterae.1
MHRGNNLLRLCLGCTCSLARCAKCGGTPEIGQATCMENYSRFSLFSERAILRSTAGIQMWNPTPI